jgi:uncharacterized membrane protein
MIITGILVLLVASPGLSRLLVLPRTEFFTELWLLGSNHMAENYPFNVTNGENYNVFLGLGNHLGYTAYYKIAVKFRNQTQSGPDSFNRTSSSLPALYEIRAFVADEATWEIPITFSFNYEYNEARSQVDVKSITVNDVVLETKNSTITWDAKNNGFLGNLFFELWIYNSTISGFQYHERFVGIWLNMTA